MTNKIPTVAEQLKTDKAFNQDPENWSDTVNGRTCWHELMKINPKGLRTKTQYSPSTKTFINDNFEDIYISILRELKNNPEFTPSPRGVGAREITNLSIELHNPLNRIVWNKARDMNYEFAMKFFIWMLNGDTDFSYVSGANKNAVNFIDKPKDDKAMPTNFSTAYGPRIVKQLPYIIEELKRDPDSRRCVIHVLNEGDLDMLGTDTKEEYPCTDSFTFMIRDGKLNMYTHMRSNNMVLTLCYDIYNMTMFHEYLFNVMRKTFPELELGTYYHNIVSAHYFDREQALVDKILDCADVGMSQKKAPAPVAQPAPVAEVKEKKAKVVKEKKETAPKTNKAKRSDITKAVRSVVRKVKPELTR